MELRSNVFNGILGICMLSIVIIFVCRSLPWMMLMYHITTAVRLEHVFTSAKLMHRTDAAHN